MMTLDDLYVVVCLAASAGLVIVGVGWAIDKWPNWRAAHDEFVATRGFAWFWIERFPWVPGTVGNPSDPSPVPRGRALDRDRSEVRHGYEIKRKPVVKTGMDPREG